MVSRKAEFCLSPCLNFRRLQPTGRPSMNEVSLLQSLGQVSASQTGEVFRAFFRKQTQEWTIPVLCSACFAGILGDYVNSSYHLSYMDDSGYRELGDGEVTKCAVQPGWFRDFASLPVRRRFVFAPHVASGSNQKRVELIGPVDAPGGDGPSNGMYALQKALRKRIDAGLDWLSIKSLPASRDAIPWFWNWADRRYAAWWDSQGLPFIQGPNMLFMNSGTPRIDSEECALLDAANCRAMFCHTPWYADLIRQHRGPANQSEIILWPYPIDPWPGEPLPDSYDLLIYAKNGHRPQLLEHLAEVFPRHVQIHYGNYRREELFEVARRSRACAYLADDDHGPLA